jgi:formylglycine-generating enzyme required for sulfatase activity
MSAPAILLSCIARAAVKNVVNFFTFGLAGDFLIDAWDAWHKDTDEAQRKREVEQLAAAPVGSVREAAQQAAAQAVGPGHPADQQRLAECLANVPAAIRRSLRSPRDPSGKTLPPGRRLASKDDLRALLPLAPSRFKVGDNPVGDWELVELLGVGGFGEVWKAVNPHMPGQPPVALKFCTDAEAKHRLLTHEARILGQLQARARLPGIVPLLRTHLKADPPCLEFEFVEGGDLAGAIRDWHANGPPDPALIASHVRDIAAAVGQAHRLSPPVVHRDIKPGNILLQKDGPGGTRFVVADFGIGGIAAHQAAQQTRRGTFATGARTVVAGSYTALYASPQQMEAAEPDPRDDVYSLGVVWHQMLTGDLNRGAPGGDAWKERLKSRGMAPPLISLLVSTIEHDREDRPENAEAFAQKLTALLKPSPPQAIPVVLPAQPVPVPKPQPAAPPQSLVNSIGMKFALIPAGTFLMGATKDIDPEAADNEAPRHQVTLSCDFYLGIYPVTQAEYEHVLGNNPSHFKGSRRPVEGVTWGEAVEFCKRLSALPEETKNGRLYRLPTEAEWEYSCRGVVACQLFNVGNKLTKADANFCKSEIGQTSEVGSYPPNAWGLYDMHGNVLEWCSDWFGTYPVGAVTNPTGSRQGVFRVNRGGCWSFTGRYCRSASRFSYTPSSRFNDLGFRIAVVPAG